MERATCIAAMVLLLCHVTGAWIRFRSPLSRRNFLTQTPAERLQNCQGEYNNECGMCGNARGEISSTALPDENFTRISGHVIDAQVAFRLGMGGEIDFRVCELGVNATENAVRCQNVTSIASYRPRASQNNVIIRLEFPVGTSCERCVVQVVYRSERNNEVFYDCAPIRIVSKATTTVTTGKKRTSSMEHISPLDENRIMPGLIFPGDHSQSRQSGIVSERNLNSAILTADSTKANGDKVSVTQSGNDGNTTHATDLTVLKVRESSRGLNSRHEITTKKRIEIPSLDNRRTGRTESTRNTRDRTIIPRIRIRGEWSTDTATTERGSIRSTAAGGTPSLSIGRMSNDVTRESNVESAGIKSGNALEANADSRQVNTDSIVITQVNPVVKSVTNEVGKFSNRKEVTGISEIGRTENQTELQRNGINTLTNVLIDSSPAVENNVEFVVTTDIARGKVNAVNTRTDTIRTNDVTNQNSVRVPTSRNNQRGVASTGAFLEGNGINSHTGIVKKQMNPLLNAEIVPGKMLVTDVISDTTRMDNGSGSQVTSNLDVPRTDTITDRGMVDNNSHMDGTQSVSETKRVNVVALTKQIASSGIDRNTVVSSVNTNDDIVQNRRFTTVKTASSKTRFTDINDGNVNTGFVDKAIVGQIQEVNDLNETNHSWDTTSTKNMSNIDISINNFTYNDSIDINATDLISADEIMLSQNNFTYNADGQNQTVGLSDYFDTGNVNDTVIFNDTFKMDHGPSAWNDSRFDSSGYWRLPIDDNSFWNETSFDNTMNLTETHPATTPTSLWNDITTAEAPIAFFGSTERHDLTVLNDTIVIASNLTHFSSDMHDVYNTSSISYNDTLLIDNSHSDITITSWNDTLMETNTTIVNVTDNGSWSFNETYANVDLTWNDQGLVTTTPRLDLSSQQNMNIDTTTPLDWSRITTPSTGSSKPKQKIIKVPSRIDFLSIPIPEPQLVPGVTQRVPNRGQVTATDDIYRLDTVTQSRNDITPDQQQQIIHSIDTYVITSNDANQVQGSINSVHGSIIDSRNINHLNQNVRSKEVAVNSRQPTIIQTDGVFNNAMAIQPTNEPETAGGIKVSSLSQQADSTSAVRPDAMDGRVISAGLDGNGFNARLITDKSQQVLVSSQTETLAPSVHPTMDSIETRPSQILGGLSIEQQPLQMTRPDNVQEQSVSSMNVDEINLARNFDSFPFRNMRTSSDRRPAFVQNTLRETSAAVNKDSSKVLEFDLHTPTTAAPVELPQPTTIVGTNRIQVESRDPKIITKSDTFEQSTSDSIQGDAMHADVNTIIGLKHNDTERFLLGKISASGNRDGIPIAVRDTNVADSRQDENKQILGVDQALIRTSNTGGKLRTVSTNNDLTPLIEPPRIFSHSVLTTDQSNSVGSIISKDSQQQTQKRVTKDKSDGFDVNFNEHFGVSNKIQGFGRTGVSFGDISTIRHMLSDPGVINSLKSSIRPIRLVINEDAQSTGFTVKDENTQTTASNENVSNTGTRSRGNLDLKMWKTFSKSTSSRTNDVTEQVLQRQPISTRTPTKPLVKTNTTPDFMPPIVTKEMISLKSVYDENGVVGTNFETMNRPVITSSGFDLIDIVNQNGESKTRYDLFDPSALASLNSRSINTVRTNNDLQPITIWSGLGVTDLNKPLLKERGNKFDVSGGIDRLSIDKSRLLSTKNNLNILRRERNDANLPNQAVENLISQNDGSKKILSSSALWDINRMNDNVPFTQKQQHQYPPDEIVSTKLDETGANVEGSNFVTNEELPFKDLLVPDVMPPITVKLVDYTAKVPRDPPVTGNDLNSRNINVKILRTLEELILEMRQNQKSTIAGASANLANGPISIGLTHSFLSNTNGAQGASIDSVKIHPGGFKLMNLKGASDERPLDSAIFNTNIDVTEPIVNAFEKAQQLIHVPLNNNTVDLGSLTKGFADTTLVKREQHPAVDVNTTEVFRDVRQNTQVRKEHTLKSSNIVHSLADRNHTSNSPAQSTKTQTVILVDQKELFNPFAGTDIQILSKEVFNNPNRPNKQYDTLKRHKRGKSRKQRRANRSMDNLLSIAGKYHMGEMAMNEHGQFEPVAVAADILSHAAYNDTDTMKQRQTETIPVPSQEMSTADKGKTAPHLPTVAPDKLSGVSPQNTYFEASTATPTTSNFNETLSNFKPAVATSMTDPGRLNIEHGNNAIHSIMGSNDLINYPLGQDAATLELIRAIRDDVAHELNIRNNRQEGTKTDSTDQSTLSQTGMLSQTGTRRSGRHQSTGIQQDLIDRLIRKATERRLKSTDSAVSTRFNERIEKEQRGSSSTMSNLADKNQLPAENAFLNLNMTDKETVTSKTWNTFDLGNDLSSINSVSKPITESTNIINFKLNSNLLSEKDRVTGMNNEGLSGSSLLTIFNQTFNGAGQVVGSDALSRSVTDYNVIDKNREVITSATGKHFYETRACPKGAYLSCRASGSYQGIPGMKWWCYSNCRIGNCPENKCKCVCEESTVRAAITGLTPDVVARPWNIEMVTDSSTTPASTAADLTMQGPEGAIVQVGESFTGRKLPSASSYVSDSQTLDTSVLRGLNIPMTMKADNNIVSSDIGVFGLNIPTAMNANSNMDIKQRSPGSPIDIGIVEVSEPARQVDTNAPADGPTVGMTLLDVRANVNVSLRTDVQDSSIGNKDGINVNQLACRGINAFQGVSRIDQWCTNMCTQKRCPLNICECGRKL